MKDDALVPDFTALRYEVRDRKAYITLNRPERLNAIDATMPGEIRRAVEVANEDRAVHVIVLGGRDELFAPGTTSSSSRNRASGHRGWCGTRSVTFRP